MDVLVIGAGPAVLGLMIAALKTNRFTELLQEDGLAVIDQGTAFGGGMLCNYGINSNTSANGFVKCIFKNTKKGATSVYAQSSANTYGVNTHGAQLNSQ